MKDIDILCTNAVDVIDKADLEARLKEGKQLRIKAGFDPSAPDIHLGHVVLLRKLRQFQDAGHLVVLIIGDYTAMIGDPSGQSKMRPNLFLHEVEKNAKTYQEQAFKILDPNPKCIEVRRNSEWLGKPDMFKMLIGNLGLRYTVARALERDDFEKRMAENQPISISEFLYPLIQGFDSVMVHADVEIGGTDQKFNLLVGRHLQPQAGFNQKPQVVMTLPLLVGLDGVKKMSKSLGNYIAVNDTAKDVFGKSMSIPDVLMKNYYDLLTSEKYDPAAHPRDAKVKLAKLLTEFLHGSKAADDQAAEFKRIFSDKENPENPEELKIAEKEIWIADLLKRAGAVTSTSEARRLIEQGAVSIDGQKVTDFNVKVAVTKGALLKAGKKKFIKLV